LNHIEKINQNLHFDFRIDAHNDEAPVVAAIIFVSSFLQT